ncbi:hypothetical protein BV25DRAFT_1843076 [Artomyces pyxidatus]|uniref:Uncharacterized protein n=1 Tax=Artomyces pyxidatus TaxID=48021 RepID=A0ACB8SGC9_9AGAM|nr:hypothetical protein BV25DRAFT_1843076 [Artomyces pyxidatus]
MLLLIEHSGITAWRNFLKRFRALQRALLKLTVFAHWWEDVEGAENPAYVPSICSPAREVIVLTLPLYAECARANLPTYIVVAQDAFNIPKDWWVNVTPRDAFFTTNVSLSSPTHSYYGTYNKPVWYYPLWTKQVDMFEAAARGWATCKDTLNPTPAYVDKLSKQQVRRSAVTGRLGCDDSGKHVELRWYLNAKNFPAYVPPPVAIYVNAVSHSLHPSTDPREFTFPPIHLFWGPQVSTQRLFYLCAQQLLPEMRSRVDCGLPGQITRDWREVLNNVYQKRTWLIAGTKYNPAVDPPFESDQFFKYASGKFHIPM